MENERRRQNIVCTITDFIQTPGHNQFGVKLLARLTVTGNTTMYKHLDASEATLSNFTQKCTQRPPILQIQHVITLVKNIQQLI